MKGEICRDRTVLRIGGADRERFLQGLVTNDVSRLADGPVYAALLTPQGKFLADFFLVAARDAILLDVKSGFAEDMAKRLGMYTLRADVTLTMTDIPVCRGLGVGPDGSLPDPRDVSLGWRHYGRLNIDAAEFDWDALRVAACIPESGIELIPNSSFILEAGFERLNGVDFAKGCYVGQEVTARMKHKTSLRKGLASVRVEGHAPQGTEIHACGRPAGVLFTQSGGRGIAYLRFDRAVGDMKAGDAVVRHEG